MMKNMRCRLRKCLSIGNSHDHDGVQYFFNADTLIEVLGPTHSLQLLTGTATMRDDLAVSLFSPANLLKLIENGKYHEA